LNSIISNSTRGNSRYEAILEPSAGGIQASTSVEKGGIIEI